MRHYLLLLSLCLPLAAQAPTGGLVGAVTDNTQALIPGAEVKVRNVATNFTQNFTTDSSGLFRFPALTSGTYELTVSAGGFRRFVQSDIRIQGAETVNVPVRLEVGDVNTTVEVAASAINVDTESSTLRGTVEQRQIAELPLNGRDIAKLVLLVPGTVDMPVGQFQQRMNFPGRSAIPSNGGRGNMVNYSLDGSNANDNYTNVNEPLPNPDTVQEMVVQTNSFSAKYGQNGGASVNVITKSGTNALHGSAFEYLRNSALNATNTFTHITDGLKRNQYGAAIGGPVEIPHVYDGRDKTFFFASYQGTKLRQLPSSTFVTLPTAAQRAGDLSSIQKAIIDPDTKQPFQNNQIPTSRFSPFATKMFAFLPVPAPLAGYPAGSAFIGTPNTDDLNEGLIKIDHQTGYKNRLSARYFVNDDSHPSQYDGRSLVTAKEGANYRYQSVAINDIYTFRSNLINQFIASLDRMQFISSQAVALGAHDDFGVNIYAPRPSQIQYSVSNYFSVNTGTFTRAPRNTFQYADNLTYIRGAHQIALGANISRLQMSLDNPFTVYGNWTYSGAVTGNQLADFLLGKENTFTQSGGQYVQIRGTTYGMYFHDDWKVSSRLTLNLGVRYEPYFPFHDKQGRGATFAPGRQSVVFPQVPAGILFEGDPGVGRGHQQADLNNLAPRIGFAWDPFGNHKFSVRGGYGMFYDINATKTYISYGQVPPFSSQVDVNQPASDIDPLKAVGNPFPLPPASKTTFVPRPVSTTARDPGRRSTYIQSWNLTLERELGSGLIARASYAGSKGTKLETAYQGNPAIYTPGVSTVANTNARRIYAGAGLSGINVYSTEGLSTYHSLQIGLDYRFKRGLTLQSSYTFSKSIDNISISGGTSPNFINPFNKNAYRGLADADATNRFVGSYVYSTTGVKSAGRVVEFLTGHWSTSGVFSAQTGLPLYISSNTDTSLSGNNGTVDLIGDPRLANPTIGLWFNKAAFALPGQGSFGNFGRNVLRGPGFWNMDFSAVRDFPLGAEQRKLQFRSEFFNVFNHVNPDQPDTTFTSQTFGRITSYNNRGPRIVQLSLKFLW